MSRNLHPIPQAAHSGPSGAVIGDRSGGRHRPDPGQPARLGPVRGHQPRPAQRPTHHAGRTRRPPVRPGHHRGQPAAPPRRRHRAGNPGRHQRPRPNRSVCDDDLPRRRTPPRAHLPGRPGRAALRRHPPHRPGGHARAGRARHRSRSGSTTPNTRCRARNGYPPTGNARPAPTSSGSIRRPSPTWATKAPPTTPTSWPTLATMTDVA